MSAPRGKPTVFPGARRPWSEPLEQPPAKVVHRDTPKEMREREICLSCPLPGCPSPVCPLPSVDAGRKGKHGPEPAPPPANFLYYGRVESVKNLCARYGCGKQMIRRWRDELGIIPDTKK